MVEHDQESKNKNPRSRSIYLKNLAKFESRKESMIQEARNIEFLLLCWEDLVYTDVDAPTIEFCQKNSQDLMTKESKNEVLIDDFDKENIVNTEKQQIYDCNLEEIPKSTFIDPTLEQNYVNNEPFYYNQINVPVINNSSFYSETIKNKKIGGYFCAIPSCRKTYTSAYGLEYHKKHGHKEDLDPRKIYKCFYRDCSKKYKNPNGLQYHIKKNHQK